nr:ankyrin repeat-containing protein [Tanacetum cinerariifolium]
MIAFLTKSDASEGFDQIVDFLNAHMIQYALMTNDVMRLQALIDRKKVIITEDTIRQALRLDDADGVDCLPNEEIFAELARMGYEKPTKYTSPTLTQKVFANMRMIGKRFSGVDTPLFDGMLMQQQVQDVKDAAEDDDHEIAQAIEITKLKQKVKRLEKKRQFKSFGLKRLRKVRTAQRVESSAETVMDDQEDASKQDTDEAEPAEVEEVIEVVIAAKLMTEVVTTTATTITAAQVPKASAPRRRMGVIIQDPEETATASVIVHSEVKASKEERKAGQYSREILKRKHVTEAQARKNMMIYLKNMTGFKMDFFKGMTYNDIRPIFKKHCNLNQAFLERVEEEVIGQKEEGNKRKGENLNLDAAKKQRIDEEVKELKTHLQIVANDDDDVYTEATPLALKVPVVDYQIHHENNKPYYKIIRADGTHQLFLSFITLLKNFDREDLEMLWKLYKVVSAVQFVSTASIVVNTVSSKSQRTHNNSKGLSDEGWTNTNRGWLLEKYAENDMWDIALQIVRRYPELGRSSTILNVLAVKPHVFPKTKCSSVKRNLNSVCAFIGLKAGAPEKERPPDSGHSGSKRMRHETNAMKTFSSRVVFIAAETGNTNFLLELIRQSSDLIWKVNDDNQTIFHIAVKYRHEDIYNLLYEIDSMKDMVTPLRDLDENNMLHLAAKSTKIKNLEDVSGAALQMQQELLWFKEVESMIPPSYRERKNKHGQTPHELFTKEHQHLISKGEKWMKETAGQCMVVAALIATIVFAAAFTVPVGYNQNDGIPMFKRKSTFVVFVVADAISLILSSASILTFLSILTSRYAERDFERSLPMKLMFGLVALFLSIGTMMVTFSVSFFALYHKQMKWIPILISVFAITPAILWPPMVTLGRLLPHARGLGFKPRRGGFPS